MLGPGCAQAPRGWTKAPEPGPVSEGEDLQLKPRGALQPDVHHRRHQEEFQKELPEIICAR